MFLYITGMGCNVPKHCPITNPYGAIPCTDNKPIEDDGFNCKGCKRRRYFY